MSELAAAAITRLYAIATLILRDSERAQDAVQEALVLAVIGGSRRPLDLPLMRSNARMVVDVYLELRDLILQADPVANGWTPSTALPHVWGALVEVGLPEGPATLVSLVDGTTSLYLGNGGGTIGAGEAVPVAEATSRLLGTLEDALEHLRPIWEFPLPEKGRVHLVALTYAGAFGAQAAESELQAGRDPLSEVYAASAKVLSEIERLETAMPDKADPSP